MIKLKTESLSLSDSDPIYEPDRDPTPIITCDKCGKNLYDGDIVYVIDDMTLCDDCLYDYNSYSLDFLKGIADEIGIDETLANKADFDKLTKEQIMDYLDDNYDKFIDYIDNNSEVKTLEDYSGE